MSRLYFVKLYNLAFLGPICKGEFLNNITLDSLLKDQKKASFSYDYFQLGNSNK